jgi:hypothetical protein
MTANKNFQIFYVLTSSDCPGIELKSFTEPENSLPCLQDPTNISYKNSHEFWPHRHTCILNINLYTVLPITPTPFLYVASPLHFSRLIFHIHSSFLQRVLYLIILGLITPEIRTDFAN